MGFNDRQNHISEGIRRPADGFAETFKVNVCAGHAA